MMYDDEALRREQRRLDMMQRRAAYGLPPVTPRNETRSFVHAFFRGLGYGFARIVMGAIRGK